MFWHGDQLTSSDACDGMQSAAIAAMAAGYSGWAVTHHDIGGYTQITYLGIRGVTFTRSEELLKRWLELGTFTNAVFRTHPGSNPNSSAQVWDSGMLDHVKTFSKLHAALSPYRAYLFAQAVSHGWPLVRHGSLVFPDDGTWYNATKPLQNQHCGEGDEVGLQQFFLGDYLLVAPVFTEHATSRQLYLPQGTWRHWWSSATDPAGRIQGPQLVTAQAPLGQPPVYWLESSPWAVFFELTSAKFREQTLFV